MPNVIGGSSNRSIGHTLFFAEICGFQAKCPVYNDVWLSDSRENCQNPDFDAPLEAEKLPKRRESGESPEQQKGRKTTRFPTLLKNITDIYQQISVCDDISDFVVFLATRAELV